MFSRCFFFIFINSGKKKGLMSGSTVELGTTTYISPGNMSLTIGGSRGGREGRTPPLGVQILSISCSFRENLACSRPPWRVHAPPLGKILDPPLLTKTSPRNMTDFGAEDIITAVPNDTNKNNGVDWCRRTRRKYLLVRVCSHVR